MINNTISHFFPLTNMIEDLFLFRKKIDYLLAWKDVDAW